MNQYGYEYGQPQGYYPPPPAQQTHHTYPASSYHANEPDFASAPSHGDAAMQSYEYNRNVIPGLALSSSATQSHIPGLMPNTAFVQPVPPPGVARAGWDGNQGNAEVPFAPAPDASEEGELSEGLGDIYEPRVDPVDPLRHLDRSPGVGAVASHGADIYMLEMDNGSSFASYPAARDRSGSYSPYLSPQEIQESDDDHVDRPTEATRVANAKPSTPTVSEARKRAQDAISHLWPLNVRFQQYIDEGIDGSILEDLFKELGLQVQLPGATEIHAPKLSAPSPVYMESETTQLAATQPPTIQPTETRPGKPLSPQIANAETSRGPEDKAEARKDRIARLLAEKGKTNSAAPSTSTSPKLPNKPPAPKAQSEKSRLLQQKMEALERSREARTRRRSRQDDQHVVTNPTPAPAPGAEAADSATDMQPSQSGTPSRELEHLVQPGATIPGLFLSTSKTSQPKNLPKRPVASDFDDSTSGPFKRPFGQTRDSRPFLINVSDDEDDEEMDIDSTGQRSPSATRPASPPRRTSSFRDHPGFSTQVPAHQVPSPGPANTPPTPGGNVGRADLESMNKKIEAMKRKIAEAEARKKAKLSQDGSPAPPQSNGHLQYEATATNNTDSPVPTPSPTTATDAEPEKQLGLVALSERLPKPSELRQSRDSDRRSRSRAASERLPLIEAHRREQLMKLQALQAQIASIEEDIAANIQEESRLREEAVDSASEQEQDRRGSAEPTFVENALPQVQDSPRIEATETSSASSDNDVQMDQSPPPDDASTSNPSAEDAMALDGQDAMGANLDRPPGDLGSASGITDSEKEYHVSEADESDEESLEDASDGYEPPEPGPLGDVDTLHAPNTNSPPPNVADLSLDNSDNDLQGVAETSPLNHQISTGQQDSISESGREVESAREDSAAASRSSFAPYETPLQYFRAYRFHPQFNQSVAGGLRSLTYSNKLDVRKPMCPDEMAGQKCPRGAQCEFQHFESIRAPDDQILLELGSYGNYEAEQKNEYINGLRQLLTDFRHRKIKDFKTISEGIIDYRARFHGDKTKVLPLGHVTL